MKFEWDLTELDKFSTRLEKAYEFETAMMTATQEIAKVLHQILIGRTPVDTGNLRKMWSAGDNLLFTVEPVKDGYMVTFENKASKKVNDGNGGEKDYYYGWIVNYSPKSKHRFFVEKSVGVTEEFVRMIDNDELNKWFGWCVNGK